MLWAMFSWKILDLAIYVNVNLTSKLVSNQLHSFMTVVYTGESGFLQQDAKCTLYTLFRSGLKNVMEYCSDFQISQISLQLSISWAKSMVT